MKITVILFLFSILSGHSQTMRQIDSVAVTICNHLEVLNEIENDTLLITTLYEDKLYPYIEYIDQLNAESIAQRIYFRLQRNCPNFADLLDRLTPPKIEFTRTRIKPISKASKKDIASFKLFDRFMYREIDGVETISKLKDNIWIDNFADGTFSKLKFNWIRENEFELIFIESNNLSRSNLSIKGDRYNYQILSKESDHFIIAINVPGQNVFDAVKLYYSF